MKYLIAFVMFLVPIFCAIGFMRMPLHGYNGNDFLLSYQEYMDIFSKAPSQTMYYFNQAIADLNATKELIDEATAVFQASGNVWEQVGNFFSLLGQYFNAFGQCIHVVFAFLSIPFGWIGWAVDTVFMATA